MVVTHLCTYGCVNDKSEVERRMTHLGQLLKHLKGKGSQQTVTDILNFTSRILIIRRELTHQRLDFANALEKVRLRICHTMLMNLYLGGFQCVHSFSKHRRKYAGHVSEKRKRILSLTIVGVLLGRICCLFVLTGFPGPANTLSNQNHFQLPISFWIVLKTKLIYQEGILYLIIIIFQKVRRKWLMHLWNKVKAV